MRRKNIFLSVLSVPFITLIFLIGSCGLQQAIQEIKQQIISMLSSMNIADAQTLYIVPETDDGTTDNILYKETTEGDIEAVKLYDHDGAEMLVDEEPTNIFDVNSEYVIIGFDGIIGFLIRKSDGAVFSLENVGFPNSNTSYITNRKAIFTDVSGNIYYLTGGKIVKIDIQDPENITKVSHSPATDSVSLFVLDNDGNAIYYGSDASYQEISRIRKVTGELINLNLFEGRVAWVGPDDHFYFFNNDPFDQVEQYDTDEWEPSFFGGQIGFNNGISNLPTYLLEFSDRILVVAYGFNEVYEVYNNPRYIHQTTKSELTDSYNKFPFSSIDRVAASSGYYYIVGDDSDGKPLLIKVDYTDDSYVELYTPGLYDIYKLVVSDDDEVTFNALRMSDGAVVIGKINSTGDLTILDETLESQVIVLERIQ